MRVDVEEKQFDYPAGFFSDDESDNKDEDDDKSEFEMRNPMKSQGRAQPLRLPYGFSSDDFNEEKEDIEDPLPQHKANRNIIPSMPNGFFAKKNTLTRNSHKHRESSSSDSDIPPPLPPSVDMRNLKIGIRPDTEEKETDTVVKKPSNEANDILAMLERGVRHKSVTSPRAPLQAENEAEFESIRVPIEGTKAHDHDILARFENPRTTARFENSKNDDSFKGFESTPPELPPRKLTTTTAPPDMPPRRLKKKSSSQAISTASSAEEPREVSQKVMQRRRTSFLENLLKEKQEKGEFDPFTYQENEPVLRPDEERETGMSKQEIEEKIRRIAQSAAAGHNTSAMGIGLRDLGYAVAMSRADESEQRINVKSIAKHAEELYQRRASSAKVTEGVRTRSRKPSTSSTSSPLAAYANPQVRTVQRQFDPIGEVSEGAYHSSVDDSASRKPSVFSTGRAPPKNKTDRFFGSMRVIDPRQSSKDSKLKRVLAAIKAKAEALLSNVKQAVSVVREKANDKSYEWRARVRAELHRTSRKHGNERF